MILIWTDHDAVTRVLADCASELQLHMTGAVHIPPPSSTKGPVQKALSGAAPKPVFFFGHGLDTPAQFVGNDGKPILDTGSAKLLQGRLVWAVACHSVNGMGKLAARHGATTVGYNGKVHVPLWAPYTTWFKQCSLSGPLALLGGSTAGDARDTLERAYRDTARHLLTGKSIEASLHGVVLDLNADAVAIAGSRGRRL